MKILTSITGRRALGTLAACLLPLIPNEAAAQFSGLFAPGNWTLDNENADGSVNTSGAPTSISLTSGNSGSGGEGATTWSRLAPTNGRVAFAWNFTTNDGAGVYDPFGYVANGAFAQLTSDALGAQVGTSGFSILSGQQMGFRARTIDNAQGASTTTVSNFVFSDRVFWKGNTNDLWNAANWTLDAAGTLATAIPDAPMHVEFSASSSANKTTTLGQNFIINGLTISDPAAVTIGGNVLTLGGGPGTGITVAGGAGLLTMTSNLNLGTAGTLNVNNSAGAVLGGIISGSNGLIKSGTGQVTLTGNNTYSGATTLTAGILQVNSSNALGNGSATNTLILNGGTLRATGAIQSPATRGVAVGVNGTVDTNGSDLSFGGPVTGTGILTKTGAGMLTLSGANTGTGSVAVAAGTLRIQNATTSGFGINGNGWTLNGGASAAGNALTLTTNVPAQARSAFLNAKVSTSGFTASFTYTASGDKAADGITFVLHNDPRGPTALGGAGGSLGYGGAASPIAPSAAVAINIYKGAGTMGARYSTNGATGMPYASGTVDPASGNPIQVSLSYDGTNILSLTLTETNTSKVYTTTYEVGNLATVTGGSTAFIGFTGGTGGEAATQTITNFTFTSTPTRSAMPVTLSSGTTLDLTGVSQAVTNLADAAPGSTAGHQVNLTSGAMTVGSAASTTFTGRISGAGGSLTKTGTGTLTLAGNNSYTAGTTIAGGAITTAGSGLGRGGVNVGASGTLNVGGVAGLAGIYYNQSPLSANFASLDLLGAHLGPLAPALLTNAPTLNFGTTGLGFPAPYNSGATNMESYYSGILNVTNPGTYTFNTSSDDGSMLWIDGVLVVNNNSFQAVTTRTGSISLSAGAHTIAVAFYQGIGFYGMNAQISGPGNTTMEDIDSSMANGLSVTSDLVVGSLSGSGNVSLQGGGLIVGTDQSSSTFTGTISASGAGAEVAGLNKFGSGTLTLGNVNLYNGRTTVNGGNLRLGHANALQNSTLYPNANNVVRFNTGIGLFNIGGLEGSANLVLEDNPGGYIEVRVGANNASTTYSGILSGNSFLRKRGVGTLTLAGANTYAAGTHIDAGTLVVNEPIAAGVSATGNGGVYVANTGTLAGGNAAGTVGSVRSSLTVASGGRLSPGIEGAGIFTVNGNTTFQSGARLQIEITGTAPGSQYDQVKATGTVALGGATLALTGSFVPTQSQEFVIINNTGAAAVFGTFAGLPEAGTITFNGVGLVISYVGGDGNDVTLRAPFIVTNALASGAGSLRQQILDATANGLITFNPSLGGKTIPLGGMPLIINKNLNIDATALTSPLTISGGGTSRVIDHTAGTVKMTNIMITGGNAGGSSGGGIRSVANLTLDRCTIFGNTAIGGAGLELSGEGANCMLRNCTIAGNTAVFGGGIFNSEGALSLTHCTVTENIGTGGSGGLVLGGGTATLSSSIVAANFGTADPDLGGAGSTLTTTRCLIGNNSGNYGSGSLAEGLPNSDGNYVGYPLEPIDPQLAPLSNYGGLTHTMPPLVGSLAINPTGGATTSTLPTDQRGFPRVVDGKTPNGAGAAIADIGAVEAGPVTLVTDSGNSGAGTLRDAFSIATAPGARILFRLPSASSVITLTGGEIFVDPGRTIFVDASSSLVTLDGNVGSEPDPIRPGSLFIPRGVTVSGNNSSRVFNNNQPTSNVALYRVKVNAGNSTSHGGGIYSSGKLTLVNSTISGCVATGRGGALFSFGDATLIQSTVSGNQSGDIGGGIHNEGASLVLRNSTVSGNTATSWGGGIFNFTAITLLNSTVANNTGTSGGGIRTQNGSVDLENTIIAGNTATSSEPDLSQSAANTFTTAGGNFIGSNSGVTAAFAAGSPNANGDFVGTSSAPLNPLLGPLANNGGPTQTMAFLGDSPAIDAGVVSVRTPITDQRGHTRILAGGMDIGAYETGTKMFNADGLTVYANVPASALSGFGVEFEISTDPNFLAVASTLAGTGAVGTTDALGVSAGFSYPAGVAQDSLGNTFVADTGNNRIRMITPDGKVSTIAGTTYGFADGPGEVAKFAFPAGIAAGPHDDNVYVADTLNHRIRKLTRPAVSGLPWTVTTIAGTGFSGRVEGAGAVARFNHPHGLAVDSTGSIYVADSVNHRIRLITPGGVVSTYAGSTSGILEGAKTAAKFNFPYGVAVDEYGDVFVADRDNNRIRKIEAGTGGLVSTFAGGATAGFENGNGTAARFNMPVAVAIDDEGNCFVTDQNNHAIRKVDADGQVTTAAGTGHPGAQSGNSTVATFRFPTGLAVSPVDGNLILADTDNHLLRRIVIHPITVQAVAGTVNSFGTGFSAVLDAEELGLDPSIPYYFRWHAVNDDFDSRQILGQSFALVPFASVTTLAADQITPTSARLNASVNPNGNPANVTFEYSTDPALAGAATVSGGLVNGNSAVTASAVFPIVPAQGATYYFRAIAGNGRGTATGEILSFTFPLTKVVTEPATNLTRTTARLNATIDPKGSSTTVKFQYSTDPALLGPYTVTTVAGSGVTGALNASGASAQFSSPQGVAFSGTDTFVADRLNHRIRRISGMGVVETFAGSTAGFTNATGAAAKFDHPAGVAADGSGNIYVADEYNHVIRKITAGGVVTTFAGSGLSGLANGAAGTARFLFPAGLAVLGGDLYVADSGNHCIRRIVIATGVVSTVAGTGIAGITETATGPAQFNSPRGVAATAASIVVADTGNHRIRQIVGGTVTTLAGSSAGYFDDTGVSAQFASPTGVAVATDGSVFVTDHGNHRIRRVDLDGETTTVAGSGAAGLLNSPVTGLHPATATNFNQPSGIAIDATGAVVIAQEGNPAVRKLARTALPEVTVGAPATGTGDRLVSADINPPLLANSTYYFRARGTNTVGTVTGAILSFTTPINPGIVVSMGTGSDEIELANALTTAMDFGITPRTQPVTKQFNISNTGGWPLTVSAITVPGGYTRTGGIGAVAPGATLACTIQLTAATAGTFAGNVTLTSDDPTQGTFVFPVTGIVLDPPVVATVAADPVNASDATLNASVNPTGSTATAFFEYSDDPQLDGVSVKTFAGADNGYLEGPAATARFNQPSAIATDALGNTYVADTLNHRIRIISAGGSVATFAGTGTAGFANGPGAAAQFNEPVGLVIDAHGTLFVADSKNHCIRSVSPTGDVSTYSGFGNAGFTDGVGTGARFNTPRGLAIDAAGILYVADSLSQRIRAVATDGSVSTIAGTGAVGTTNGAGNVALFNGPTGIAVGPTGILYITESGTHAIRQILTDANRTVSIFAGSSGTAGTTDDTGAAARFSSPTGLLVDSAGRINVADKGNHRIRQVTAAGVVTTLAGTTLGALDGAGTAPGAPLAQFDTPASMALDATEALLIGELGHSRIRRIASNNLIVQAATGLTGVESLPVALPLTGLETGKTYYFRAFATNGGGTTYGSIESFEPAARSGSPFQAWQVATYGADASDPLIAGPHACPMHDGVPNLLKYALGFDAEMPPQSCLPVVGIIGNSLTLTYTKVLSAIDLIYTVESSTDLLNWGTAGISEAILSDDGTTQRIRASVPVSGAPGKYIRLKVALQ